MGSVFAFDVCLTATARVISTGSASPCQHHERGAVRPPNRTGCLRSDLRLCIGAALARHSRELRPAFGDTQSRLDAWNVANSIVSSVTSSRAKRSSAAAPTGACLWVIAIVRHSADLARSGRSLRRRSARELRGRSRSESDRRRLARFPCMAGEIRRQLDARSARKAAPDTGVQNDGAHPAPVARASVAWQACPRAVVGLFRAEQITVSC